MTESLTQPNWYKPVILEGPEPSNPYGIYSNDHYIDRGTYPWNTVKQHETKPEKELSRKEIRELARRVHEKVWLQEDGTEISISDMDPEQLSHTLILIRQRRDTNLPAYREYIKLIKNELKNQRRD